MPKKYYLLLLLIPVVWLAFEAMNFSDPRWLTDFETAKKKSEETGKPILLVFSGSDWCGICMKMKKNIWDTEAFKDYANDNLILVQADFPRMKKNKLDERTEKQNESLADRYNHTGGLPYTILINTQGKVLKDWKGYANEKPDAFIDQIKKCK